MKVKPMPKMSKQIYVKIFINLNCGWYCLESMLAHWFEVVNSKPPVSMPLPCYKLGGFHPANDLDSSYSSAIQSGKKPDTADAWEKFLAKSGPVIVMGQIGGLDFDYWGYLGSLRSLPFGHFILVVGASANKGAIYYKDPLVGDKIETYQFSEFDSKISGTVYWTTQNGAIKIFNSIGAK